MKIANYKLVKVTINALGFAKIIINIVMHYYSLLDLIVNDYSLVYTLKF